MDKLKRKLQIESNVSINMNVKIGNMNKNGGKFQLCASFQKLFFLGLDPNLISIL